MSENVASLSTPAVSSQAKNFLSYLSYIVSSVFLTFQGFCCPETESAMKQTITSVKERGESFQDNISEDLILAQALKEFILGLGEEALGNACSDLVHNWGTKID